jgi:hypothetical protein
MRISDRYLRARAAIVRPMTTLHVRRPRHVANRHPVPDLDLILRFGPAGTSEMCI